MSPRQITKKFLIHPVTEISSHGEIFRLSQYLLQSFHPRRYTVWVEGANELNNNLMVSPTSVLSTNASKLSCTFNGLFVPIMGAPALGAEGLADSGESGSDNRLFMFSLFRRLCRRYDSQCCNTHLIVFDRVQSHDRSWSSSHLLPLPRHPGSHTH